ncbi:MAG: AhpC/TSA family protein [Rhodobacterales bacterium]|nr:AhpC/TSA family protein [Rhodobacterales bacterium]
MTLADDLRAQQDAAAQRMPADVLAVMARVFADLAASGLAGRALGVGDRAPDFTLPDATGKPLSSADLRARGPLVISFYRGSWCPYCNLELRALQALAPDFAARGARLVAISPEQPDGSLSLAEKHALTFDVLSDAGNATARAFGLVYTVDPELRAIYTDKFNIDLPAHNGDDSWELPMPGTYVVGADGVITFAQVDSNHQNRAEPADVLAALG